jgi:hypothetical protein
VVVVVSLNMLDPLLDAMEAPQEPPPRGRKAFDGVFADAKQLVAAGKLPQ